ncbi:hypothetical protein [Niabella drilacis]|uniref:Ig-like domain (Group 2) n=1 Tax=Niabella drilacis (strain DSM 25811 / CCM 8410 / CCUG 62505 / LMG 26954 / E90) TaxID=1285928 RepID=A0A1G6JGL3_NIADE|nr:hypothetical protein [Niabella drilacis]SDC17831.1 hypothetical protein SAMN04487894_101530 [Niabella drilacis]
MNTIFKTGYLLGVLAVLLTVAGSCKKDKPAQNGPQEKKLALDRSEAIMEQGTTTTIKPIFDDGEVTIPAGKYSWTSDDPAIASVYMNKDFTVTVTGRKIGSTKVRLSAKYGGGLEQVCTIVVEPPPSILINFGDGAAGAEWNSVKDNMRIDGFIPDLHTQTGRNTGIALKVEKRFNLRGASGATNTDTELKMPDEVSFDGYYGNAKAEFSGVVATESVIRFSGMDKTKKYRYCFYASRMGVGDNRETQYTITGSNQAVARLNASGNVNNIVCAGGVQPDAGGDILLTITAGENNNNAFGFYYINAMRIMEDK